MFIPKNLEFKNGKIESDKGTKYLAGDNLILTCDTDYYAAINSNSGIAILDSNKVNLYCQNDGNFDTSSVYCEQKG